MARYCSIRVYGNRAGGMAQVVQHLPGKCEVLSANPNTAKQNKNKQPYRV
jgi:hypothetical protein